MPRPLLTHLVALTAIAAFHLPAQEWTTEQLTTKSTGFQSLSLTSQLEQVGELIAAEAQAFAPIVALIHGDHREYRVKIDNLLQELGDRAWSVRENAERTLVEVGGRARKVIQQRRDNTKLLERKIRCSRILDALDAKGTEQEDREQRLLRGLVRTALYMQGTDRLLRSLRSALGHTDSSIAGGAIRAIGKHGGDNEANAIALMVKFKSGIHRDLALSALARMNSAKALAHCRSIMFGAAKHGPLEGVVLDQAEMMRIIRALRARSDSGAKQLLAELAGHSDPVIAKGAAIVIPPETSTAPASLMMPDRTQVTGTLGNMFGDSFEIKDAFRGLPITEMSFSDCSTIDFPNHAIRKVWKAGSAMVFLNQGSRISGNVTGIDPLSIQLSSPVFGELTLPRQDVQGIAFDPKLDRLVGASADHDRLRMRNGTFIDGTIDRMTSDKVGVLVGKAPGTNFYHDIDQVGGIMFTRPLSTEQDPTSYARIDLVTGERLIGFIAGITAQHVAVTVPLVGACVLPWARVRHVELGVGGGAMWGFTLIADYSENRVVEVDDQGRVVFVLDEIYGAWDAECLDSGNLLITEFSVSSVQEVDRQGKTIWKFEDLKNPYDADRLPNGNTLIADTFASRVIEVNKEGEIVWSYAQDIRPFDCDRLANGNTLIADVLKDRVIEISPAGEIVWEAKGVPNAHDADRLPNGNTLVTLRNKGAVMEIDRDGKVVFEISGLSSPSDADRLPNGNTIVAENNRVREFDRNGNTIWEKEMTWAVEVNRY